jgi:hypothetical protein
MPLFTHQIKRYKLCYYQLAENQTHLKIETKVILKAIILMFFNYSYILFEYSIY